MKKITFCIPTKNNLRYLKGCIQSIRENSTYDNDIIVFVDSDNDGTIHWLKENSINCLINDSGTPKGIAYGYNRCIESAKTNIVCMFHADMYMAKGFDTAILKHLKPLSVVSGTRIEPPLHPKGQEKVVEDFGMYPEDFKKDEFEAYTAKFSTLYEGVTTRGIFAPWAIYKEDITSMGMHDEMFHSYHEDSDIFNRFILNGYEIIQTWEGLVYHLTCRGGQFQDGIEKVTTDTFFHKMKNNAFRNYVRKWGSFIKNDIHQYPIIPHKYNIGLYLKNGTPELLNMLEPWCSSIFVSLPNSVIQKYITDEQPNTNVNLKEKINSVRSDSRPDITVTVDGSKLTQQSINFIFTLCEILDANDLVAGEYDFDIFSITVYRINHIEKNLINNK